MNGKVNDCHVEFLIFLFVWRTTRERINVASRRNVCSSMDHPPMYGPSSDVIIEFIHQNSDAWTSSDMRERTTTTHTIAEVHSDECRHGCFSGCWCADVWLHFMLPYTPHSDFFFALCLTPGARLPVLGPHGGAFVPTLDMMPCSWALGPVLIRILWPEGWSYISEAMDKPWPHNTRL